jgi:hypothetical protein
MSEKIGRLRVLTLKFVGHFSGVSRTFWEEYVRPESMIVDTLGVYCSWITEQLIQAYHQYGVGSRPAL